MQCPITFGSGLTSTFDLISLNGSGSSLVLVNATIIAIAIHQGSNPILFCSGPLPLWQNCVFAAALDPVTTFLGNMVSCTPGSVPCSHSHFHSLSKHAVHYCHAPGAGHCMICYLSLSSVLHLEHHVHDCCPWHCMFLPCANCPIICFVTHLCMCARILLMTLSSASVSSLDNEGDRLGILVCQYCHAGRLFNALCSASFGFLAVCFPLISRCHGL